MNIYDFFNSPDVAEYCQSIGHNFNALESAVMINQSNTRTLAEKHAAYKTIIAEYPDMEIPEAVNHGHIKSFHQALTDIIAHEEQTLAKLLLPEVNAVYNVSRWQRLSLGGVDGRTIVNSYSDDECYTTFEKAFSGTLGKYDDEDLDNILRAEIFKRILDSDNFIAAQISHSGEIIKVDNCGAFSTSKDYEFSLLDCCYIDVPVPFKRGDLVECDRFGDFMGSVYVIQEICRDDPKLTSIMQDGDLTDMTASVHYLSDTSNTIECEVMHFYPDLRYCKRDLKGGERMLKYVSLYMQDKLCLCNLLKLQTYFLLNKNMSEDFLAEIIAKEYMLA